MEKNFKNFIITVVNTVDMFEAEVQRELDNGATSLEALREWDIVQFVRVLSKTINCSLFS